MDQQVTVFVKGIITPHDSFGDEVPKTPVSIAITGSIFADEEDAARTGVFHGSYFPSDFRGDANSGLSIWRQSRDRLLERSEWIFPAFGCAFKVVLHNSFPFSKWTHDCLMYSIKFSQYSFIKHVPFRWKKLVCTCCSSILGEAWIFQNAVCWIGMSGGRIKTLCYPYKLHCG